MDQLLQAAVMDQLKDSTLALACVLGGVLLLARLGHMQPSRRTFILLLLPVPLLLLGFVWPWVETVVALYTPLLMLVLMLDGFLLSIPHKNLELRRALSRKLSIGQHNAVVITVVNNSPQALEAEIRDDVPTGLLAGQFPPTLPVRVAASALETVTYMLTPDRRGQYPLGRIYLRYRSRLKLLWLVMEGGRPEEVTVTPDLRRMKRMRVKASHALTAGELRKRSLGTEGTQFSGLRHYFAGDDMRRMAWQATAKQDLPVVRTFEHEVEQPILVLIDAGRRMAAVSENSQGQRLQKYDWALNAALAFIGVAVDRHDHVGVGLFSNRVLATISPNSGRGHLNRVLEVLSQSQVQSVESEYEPVMLQFARQLRRRSLVIVFTDLSDPLAADSLRRSLKVFAGHHVLMVVTLADPDVARLTVGMPEDAYGAYQKGVALDLGALRQRVLAALKQGQAIAIDAPPERLDEALVEQYLRLKRKAIF